MIIHAIRAENFMKFSRLKLSGLPSRGLIGIEGPNESGKTTIGEAVLFALFGKTRTSLETSVSRLVSWGSDYLSVELEFEVPGRGEYLIYREIDKYGTNFVKVIDRATRAEVASGNVNVSEFLSRTLRFDFFEFHQSFYHDQFQAVLPRDSQASFVDRMTGISQIQEALSGLKKDIEGLEREFAHYQKDIQRNLQQMEKYDRNAAKLPELRELAGARGQELERARGEHRRRQEEVESFRRLGEERHEVGRRLERLAEEPAAAIGFGLEEVRTRLKALASGTPVEREFAERCREELRAQIGRIEALEAMLNAFQGLRRAYEEHAAVLEEHLDPEGETSYLREEERLRDELSRAQSRARRARLVSSVCLVLALLSGGTAAGYFLRLLPPPPSPGVGRLLPWAAAGVSALLLLLGAGFVVKRGRAGTSARHLQVFVNEQAMRIRVETEERDRVAALLSTAGPGDVVRFVKGAETTGPSRASDLYQQLLREHGKLVEAEGEGEYRRVLLELARAERDLRARAAREVQRVERSVQEAEAAVKKARGDLEKVENEIRECESQAAKKETLLLKNSDLQTRSNEVRKVIELRRLAIELLEDTSSSLRNKIGPSLSRFIRELLPRLTRGRYRDIKVGSDLSLQIFTSEKSDFLDPAELSGGTHEALALALRLAISQAFIAARTRQAQFVFLDEPFKMMDEARVRETLSVLRSLSLDLRQLFVVQPNFTREQRVEFDWMIETAVERAELVLSRAAAAGEPEPPAPPQPEPPAPAQPWMAEIPAGIPSGPNPEAGGGAGETPSPPSLSRLPPEAAAPPPRDGNEGAIPSPASVPETPAP